MGAERRRSRRDATAGVVVDRTLYPGARHELLNETNRDEVTADIAAWIDSNVAS